VAFRGAGCQAIFDFFLWVKTCHCLDIRVRFGLLYAEWSTFGEIVLTFGKELVWEEYNTMELLPKKERPSISQHPKKFLQEIQHLMHFL